MRDTDLLRQADRLLAGCGITAHPDAPVQWDAACAGREGLVFAESVFAGTWDAWDHSTTMVN